MSRSMVPALAAVLAVQLLAACGVDPADPTKRSSSTRVVVSVPNNVGLGDLARNHLGGSTYDDGRGGDLLGAARRAIAASEGFQCKLVARIFGAWDGGVERDASREVRVVYDLAWARPNRFYAKVLENNEGAYLGLRLATQDGLKFDVRSPGLFGRLVRQIDVADRRLRNARGHEMTGLRPDAQFARLLTPQAIWTVIGEGRTPDGQPTVRIGVENVPRLDREIDREEIEVVQGTFALHQMVSYVGMRRVVGYEFQDYRGSAPPPEAFGL